MTDQEINEAVAIRLKIAPKYVDKNTLKIPDYCHSIAAAWEIVEKLFNEGVTVQIGVGSELNPKQYACWVGNVNTKRPWSHNDTAPMAICQAFLKLP